jgi:hypothetical protein
VNCSLGDWLGRAELNRLIQSAEFFLLGWAKIGMR